MLRTETLLWVLSLNLLGYSYTIVLQLDNAAFHKAKGFCVLENVALLFQPPYSPELNLIDRVGEHIKQDIDWNLVAHHIN